MFWPKAACVLLLPMIAFNCSSGGNFSCNTNTNGRLFKSETIKTEMSISYATATRRPCGFNLRGLASNVDVSMGNKSLVITKADFSILPKHGTVEREDNYISYNPQSNYVGTDNFAVIVAGSDGSNTGVSTISFSVDVK